MDALDPATGRLLCDQDVRDPVSGLLGVGDDVVVVSDDPFIDCA